MTGYFEDESFQTNIRNTDKRGRVQGVTGERAAEAEKLVKIAILKLTELEMWANAQRDGRPADCRVSQVVRHNLAKNRRGTYMPQCPAAGIMPPKKLGIILETIGNSMSSSNTLQQLLKTVGYKR